MRFINVDLNETCRGVFLEQLLAVEAEHHAFVINFDNLWHDHGEMISMQYTGEQAKKQEKTGFLDSIFSSAERTIEDNGLFDQAIMSMAGSIDEVKFDEAIEGMLRKSEREFCSFSDISFFVLSWNVNGVDPSKIPNIEAILDFEGHAAPDLLIFGFQEIVTLNPQNLIMSNEDRVLAWIRKLTEIVNTSTAESYSMMAQEDLVGLLLIVYARNTVKSRIRKVNHDSVKTGVAGTLGNKGANIIKFLLDDSSFAFVNAHLEPGQNKVADRLNNVSYIHKNAFQDISNGKKPQEKIELLDYKFFFGDLNFRVNQGYHEMCEKLAAISKETDHSVVMQMLGDLLNQEQLLLAKPSHEYLQNYWEGLITFFPTYKYDSGTNDWDTKKSRVPSWCDRIMLWNSVGFAFKQLYYKRMEYLESDHRPVASYFVLQVKKVIREKREALIRELYMREGKFRFTAASEEEFKAERKKPDVAK
jgi:phosphatidylinositol-bisphosphatase